MAISAVLLASFATASFAAKNFVSAEHAVETSSDAVVLPSGPDSALVVTPCAGCAPVSIPATAKSVYLLKNTPVTLAEFKLALTGKRDIMMTVLRSTKTGELTRIIASLDAPATATSNQTQRAPASTPARTAAPSRKTR